MYDGSGIGRVPWTYQPLSAHANANANEFDFLLETTYLRHEYGFSLHPPQMKSHQRLTLNLHVTFIQVLDTTFPPLPGPSGLCEPLFSVCFSG